jgi:type IV fimbrial biogenesis protein FimT
VNCQGAGDGGVFSGIGSKDDQHSSAKDDPVMADKKGFTVVEIMVVLGIVGISAVLAVPSVVELTARFRLRGAARQVMGDLMWARMQAVSEKNEFKVLVLSDHEYIILDDDDNDGKVDGKEWIGVRDMRDAYPDVTVRFSADPIFFARGCARSGTITLTNKSGSKKVKIHITGRVKIA